MPLAFSAARTPGRCDWNFASKSCSAGKTSNSAPRVSSFQIRTLSSMKSMMPMKGSSLPRGDWMGAGAGGGRGGVNDVDEVLTAEAGPGAGGSGRGDGDAALALLLHPVHRGRALVHLADLVGDAGVVQDAFGRSGLAGIDVGHDAEVAQFVERGDPRHNLCSSSSTPVRSLHVPKYRDCRAAPPHRDPPC